MAAEGHGEGDPGEKSEEISDGDDGHDSDNSEQPSIGVEEDTPATPKAGATDETPRGLDRKSKKNGVFLANLPYEVCDEKRLPEIFAQQGFGRIVGVVLTKPPEGKT